MGLQQYFEGVKGTGVLATVDAEGKVGDVPRLNHGHSIAKSDRLSSQPLENVPVLTSTKHYSNFQSTL